MSQIFSILSCLLIFVALTDGISARSCRIVFLERPDSAPKTLYLFDGEKIREVQAPRLNLSDVYELPDGNLNLRFFVTPPSDLKTIPQDTPSAKIAEATKDVYLVLFSNPGNAVAPFSVQAVSADTTNFLRGQMLWFNLTGRHVGGKVGSEKLDLKPLARSHLGEPHQGAGDYPVVLYFMIEGDTHIHPLCESRWQHDPRSRSLVFISNNGTRRAPRIYSFSDFREPQKKEGE